MSLSKDYKMRLGDRTSLASIDTAYRYDMDTLIMHIPYSKEIIKDQDILSYERGLFHEYFHWMQHHGTTIGSLLSLIRYSQELTVLKWFPQLSKELRSSLYLNRESGQRIIPIDTTTMDLPPFQNEDKMPELLYRVWHDHLLVYTMILDSVVQDNIAWPRLTAFSEVMADAILACESTGMLSYPGNEVARKAYLFTKEPKFVSTHDGFRITTRSLLETAARINEWFVIDGIASSQDDKNMSNTYLNQLLEGTPEKVIELFQIFSLTDNRRFNNKLPTIALICDIALNPPVPPIVNDFDRKFEWSDIYPPERFCRLSKAVSVFGILPNTGNKEILNEYIANLCEFAKIDNPANYLHPYSTYADKIDYSNISDEELTSNYGQGKLNYFDYVLWIQSKLFELRRNDYSWFINFGDSLHGDLSVKRFSYIVGDAGHRWFKPPLFSLDDDILFYKDDANETTRFGSLIAIERAKYNSLYDIVFCIDKNMLSQYPHKSQVEIWDYISQWIREKLGVC